MDASLLKLSMAAGFLSLWCAGPALRAEIVDSCDEASLRAALAIGGTVTLGCDARPNASETRC